MVINLRYVRNLIKLDLSGSQFSCLLGNIMTVSLLKFPIDTILYELFNVLLHHGSTKSKRLTTKILKLSAAIHLNLENQIFVDLNLFFRTT